MTIENYVAMIAAGAAILVAALSASYLWEHPDFRLVYTMGKIKF